MKSSQEMKELYELVTAFLSHHIFCYIRDGQRGMYTTTLRKLLHLHHNSYLLPDQRVSPTLYSVKHGSPFFFIITTPRNNA